METPPPSPARRLWQVIEPIHAVVYFAPEPAEAAKQVGLKGFWMGYFAGRSAPMGPIEAPVATATFYGFHPAMPERALPDAWTIADPATVLTTRVVAVAAALRRCLGAALDDAVGHVGSLVAEAAEAAAADTAGRPLGAAWPPSSPRAMPWPTSGWRPAPSVSSAATATSPPASPRGSIRWR